eukprot:6191978-Pleurochrysis_carterae.AAC.1
MGGPALGCWRGHDSLHLDAARREDGEYLSAFCAIWTRALGISQELRTQNEAIEAERNSLLGRCGALEDSLAQQ